jgi:prepilin-type N-terminal cleavage/methylation domain-containing protein
MTAGAAWDLRSPAATPDYPGSYYTAITISSGGFNRTITLFRIRERLSMAMKKLIRNNRGFTLVELLVTFGILAVVMVMVGVIIGMSSGTYKNISDDLNLQYESQLAMSQIQEYVIDWQCLRRGGRSRHP